MPKGPSSTTQPAQPHRNDVKGLTPAKETKGVWAERGAAQETCQGSCLVWRLRRSCCPTIKVAAFPGSVCSTHRPRGGEQQVCAGGGTRGSGRTRCQSRWSGQPAWVTHRNVERDLEHRLPRLSCPAPCAPSSAPQTQGTARSAQHARATVCHNSTDTDTSDVFDWVADTG